jgi:M6 family metalloprotease-like protein
MMFFTTVALKMAFMAAVMVDLPVATSQQAVLPFPGLIAMTSDTDGSTFQIQMMFGSEEGGLDDIVEKTIDGFTVVFDETVGLAGDYVFATRDDDNDDEFFSSNNTKNSNITRYFKNPHALGEVVSTGIPVTSANQERVEAQGWPPKHVRRSSAALEAHLEKLDREGNRMQLKKKKTDKHDDKMQTKKKKDKHDDRRRKLQDATSAPTVRKILVIPIRFKNHHPDAFGDSSVTSPAYMWSHTREELELLFQHEDADGADAGPYIWRGTASHEQYRNSSVHNTTLYPDYPYGKNPQIAPKGTVQHVWRKNTYDNVKVQATVLDWIDMPAEQWYYAQGRTGKTARMREGLEWALSQVDANNASSESAPGQQRIDWSDYDYDGDGYVDSVVFLHSGYGGEFGGFAADGQRWKWRIWSHMGELTDVNADGWASSSIIDGGIKVKDYYITSSHWERGHNIKFYRMNRISNLSQVLGKQLFGLPGLDNLNSVGTGVGSWGLMGNAWGFDGSQNCPPLVDPYTKIQQGWLEPVEVTEPGTFFIKNSQDYPEQVLKISHNFPDGEYLLVEYRAKHGLEYCLPTSPVLGNNGGLAIWHIDETKAADNSDSEQGGSPEQSGWPSNGNHYKVALLQADGGYGLETSNTNKGDYTDLFFDGWVDSLTTDGIYQAGTKVSSYPNTDTYQNGIVTSTKINITDIAIEVDPNGDEQEDYMSVTIDFPYVKPPLCPKPYQKLFELDLILLVDGDDVISGGGLDITWSLRDPRRDHVVIMEGGPYADNDDIHVEQCLNLYACYNLHIYDSSGDTMMGSGYTVKWNGQVVAERMDQSVFAHDTIHLGMGCYSTEENVSKVEVDLIDSSSGTIPAPAPAHGLLFDLTVNEFATQDLVIWKADSPLASVTTPTNYTYKVYTKSGTYVEYENTPHAWTLVKSQEFTLSPNSFQDYTDSGFFFWSVPIRRNTTQAFYIVMSEPLMTYVTEDENGQVVTSTNQVYKTFEFAGGGAQEVVLPFELSAGQYVELGPGVSGADFGGSVQQTPQDVGMGLWNGRIAFSPGNMFANHMMDDARVVHLA